MGIKLTRPVFGPTGIDPVTFGKAKQEQASPARRECTNGTASEPLENTNQRRFVPLPASPHAVSRSLLR